MTVGFQPKQRRIAVQGRQRDMMQSSITKNQSVEETVNETTGEGGPGKQRTLNASQYSSAKGNSLGKYNFLL